MKYERLRDLLNPVRLTRHCWARRDVIAQLTRREVASLYRESLLGALWSLIQPLVTLAVYSFVFLVIFEPRAADGSSPTSFVLGMFCGIVIYGVFADTLSRAPLLVLSNPSYVKRIVFPLEVLAVSNLGANLVNLATGLAILILGSLVLGQPIPATILLLPIPLLPLLLLSLGLSWFLASTGVFLRDMQQVVRVVLQILFFLTPIVWTLDFLPEAYHQWVYLNPLTTIVEGVRAVAVVGAAPNWAALGWVTLLAAAVHLGGYAWFMKTRHGFADVL